MIATHVNKNTFINGIIKMFNKNTIDELLVVGS